MTSKQLTDLNEFGISRRRIMQATGAVAIGSVAFTGTASANCPCTGVTLGKIESEELPACGETTTVTLTLDSDLRIADDSDCQDDKAVDVKVTATECKGNEPTCVELEIVDDNGACKCADDGLYLNGAIVKAGPTQNEYDCDDVEDRNQKYSRLPNACAPINPNNNQRYGISHITVEVCVFPNDKQTGDDCANGGGG